MQDRVAIMNFGADKIAVKELPDKYMKKANSILQKRAYHKPVKVLSTPHPILQKLFYGIEN